MARSRFAVAVLPAASDAAAIDVLRSSVGVPEPFHVPPHMTLVPPTNVASGQVDEALSVLRRAAAAAAPMDLDVGPATTFLPDTATLHLEVGGDVEDLRSLRELLRDAPFDRPDKWPFSPHVTIAENADPAVIDAGIRTFAGLGQRWSVGALHLLEQRRWPEGHVRAGQVMWVPVREEPLGGPLVTGRGGIELHLRTVSMVEPQVAALLGIAATTPPVRPGGIPVVVVAEAPESAAAEGGPGGLIAAVAGCVAPPGRVAELDRFAVADAHRRQGVAARMLNWWCRHVAELGADIIVTGPFESVGGTAGRLLDATGFRRIDRRWAREL